MFYRISTGDLITGEIVGPPLEICTFNQKTIANRDQKVAETDVHPDDLTK